MNQDVGHNWLMTHVMREIRHWKRLSQDMSNPCPWRFLRCSKHQDNSSKFRAEPSLTQKFHQRHPRVPPNLCNSINPSPCQGFSPGISAQDRDVLMHPKINKGQERRLKMLFCNFESSWLLPSKGIGQKLQQDNTELSGNALLAKTLTKIKNKGKY